MLKRLVLLFVLPCVLSSSVLVAGCGRHQRDDNPVFHAPITSNEAKNIRQMDEWIRGLHRTGRFNGCVLYAENGEIVYQVALGTDGSADDQLLTIHSSFNLASVSKQFTAMGIMILQRDGKLDYDDSIVKYLPEFNYPDITIRNLLNHTSGLADYILMTTPRQISGKVLDNADFIRLFAKKSPKLEFQPGSRFEYSNTGYVALSIIIERASGQRFSEFMSAQVLRPARMENASVFNLLSSPDRLPNRVYGMDDDKRNDLSYLDGIAGDGGVYASASDLFAWDQALYRHDLLPETEQEQAFAPVHLPDGSTSFYGFGWDLDQHRDIMLHNGSWAGFNTYIRRNREKRSLMVVLENGSHPDVVGAVVDAMIATFE